MRNPSCKFTCIRNSSLLQVDVFCAKTPIFAMFSMIWVCVVVTFALSSLFSNPILSRCFRFICKMPIL